MRVVLVGGSGFIGSRLARRLKRRTEAELSIFDKAESHAFPELGVIGDIRSKDDLRSGLPDHAALIHLAAEHRDDVKPVSLYQQVNVDGTRNICAVAREKGINTIVFTSSVAVYGFAPAGTGGSGPIAPFNNYGRTKYEAELILSEWQREAPHERTLTIVRPTVVFGERNRGNVYNLLRQIASGRFVMVGKGENRKSTAYVENVAAFLEHALALSPGIYVVNFVDQPALTMNELVLSVYRILGRPAQKIGCRLPYPAGLAMGKFVDMVAAATGARFPISATRIKKFASDSVYSSAIATTGFTSPVSLADALEQTVRYEFVEDHHGEVVYYSE